MGKYGNDPVRAPRPALQLLATFHRLELRDDHIADHIAD